MQVALKEGKYIYCIINSNHSQIFDSVGIGDRGDKLYTICFNNIAAVVSDSPIIKYPISRENTLAHEKAIEKVMQAYTVLPVRFGTIAEDEEKIKKILEKEYDKFKDLLDKMAGKKELGLKAIFKENIFAEILNHYPKIRLFKEKISEKPAQATYYERIELGKMVEDALLEEKAKYKDKMLAELSPLALEFRDNHTYDEKMVLNTAFLLDSEKEFEFDNKVNLLQELYGNLINFKYVYTPPFNFVNLLIEIGKY